MPQRPHSAEEIRRRRGGKIGKEEADYVDHPVAGRRCSQCSMFVPAQGCTLVRGLILPMGHCKHWKAKAG